MRAIRLVGLRKRRLRLRKWRYRLGRVRPGIGRNRDRRTGLGLANSLVPRVHIDGVPASVEVKTLGGDLAQRTTVNDGGLGGSALAGRGQREVETLETSLRVRVRVQDELDAGGERLAYVGGREV
jgi:hypothetical protein